MRNMVTLLVGICVMGTCAGEYLTDANGVKLPNTCVIIYDTTAPATSTISAVGSVGSYPIRIYFGSATDKLSGINSVHLYVKVVGSTTGWIDTGLTTTSASGSLAYTPPSSLTGKPLAFAIRANDLSGNWSDYLAETPQGWFSYPDSNRDMELYLRLPFGRSLSEYLTTGSPTITADSQIGKVGMGGPNGWGLGSTDLVSFEGLPIQNLWTNLDNTNLFRGTPFVVSKTGGVKYFNLGPYANPNWKFWFGGNSKLVINDGSGGSIISFSLANYTPITLPKASFYTSTSGLRVRINPNVNPGEIGRLFYYLPDESKITEVGLMHYYLSGGSFCEKIAFKGWPADFPVKAYQGKTVRTTAVVLCGITTYYANLGFWGASELDKQPVSKVNGAWQFVLP